jgi:hypothetical protein
MEKIQQKRMFWYFSDLLLVWIQIFGVFFLFFRSDSGRGEVFFLGWKGRDQMALNNATAK